MKVLMKILVAGLPLILLMTACGAKVETAAPNTQEGPALIIFYTDN